MIENKSETTDDSEKDKVSISSKKKISSIKSIKSIKSISSIDSESSEASDIDFELTMKDIKRFDKIEEIPEFLETVKNHYLNLTLNLDRHEISRLITKTLNVALLGEITTEQQIYRLIIDDYDTVKSKVKTIITKIREFNKSTKYEYWVDLDKIVYILWFKEIKFVKNLIIDISENLEYQLNIVHVISYLIDKLYNDPRYTKYYIKILLMIIEQDSEELLNTDKLKNFFTSNKINKIYEIIRLVLNCDIEFLSFIDNFHKNLLDKEKENNDNETDNNFINIEDQEKEFRKEKKQLLLSEKKRKLDVELLFKDNQKDTNYYNKNVYKFFTNKDNNPSEENVKNMKDIISILSDDNDTWNALNLFIYKKFEIKFEDYIKRINEIVPPNLNQFKLDFFNDLEVPFTIRLNPDVDGDRGTILRGGDSIYFKKYLKYKEKYLKLKYIKI
jgi:hypothetical protein